MGARHAVGRFDCRDTFDCLYISMNFYFLFLKAEMFKWAWLVKSTSIGNGDKCFYFEFYLFIN